MKKIIDQISENQGRVDDINLTIVPRSISHSKLVSHKQWLSFMQLNYYSLSLPVMDLPEVLNNKISKYPVSRTSIVPDMSKFDAIRQYYNQQPETEVIIPNEVSHSWLMT